MKPVILIGWDELADSARAVAPVMATCLETVAAAIRLGEASGTVCTPDGQRLCPWVVETEVSFDVIRQALGMEQ